MRIKKTQLESQTGEARVPNSGPAPGREDSELQAMGTVYGALQTLTPDEQSRVLAWVEGKLRLPGERRATGNSDNAAGLATPPSRISESSPISAKRFLAEKKPTTDVERVVCLAYFQTHLKGGAKFKTRDLTQLNTESAQPPLSNPAFTVVNATNGGYLAPAGGGFKQITVRGEALVEALPDREKVKVALDANQIGRRKRRRSGPNRGA
jgi:hypothetical protein